MYQTENYAWLFFFTNSSHKKMDYEVLMNAICKTIFKSVKTTSNLKCQLLLFGVLQQIPAKLQTFNRTTCLG